MVQMFFKAPVFGLNGKPLSWFGGEVCYAFMCKWFKCI